MIRGMLDPSFAAVVRLKVLGTNGAELEIDSLVDTGFSSELTLPQDAVTFLNLKSCGITRYTLADGSEYSVDLYEAKLEWDTKVRDIVVSCTGTGSLIGMELLMGHELRIAIEPSGAFEIKPLP